MSAVDGDSLRASMARLRLTAFVVGVVSLAIAVAGVGLLGVMPRAFFRSYLVAFQFWFGLGAGSLAILLLHHLVGGGWGIPIRRPLEAGAATLPLLALLFVPIAFSLHEIYPWARPLAEITDRALLHKRPYLNPNFFLIRAFGYFAIWNLTAFYLNRWSAQQDQTPDQGPSRKMQAISGPGLALFFVTASFAAIDWLMTLEPDWYSTIYGPMVLVGQGLSAFAWMIVVAARVVGSGSQPSIDRTVWFRDMGNLLLSFVMLWAYMTFAQFLIIWCGNLTEEIPWYIRRTRGGWQWIAVSLIVFHFFAPFFVLLFQEMKRRAEWLQWVARVIVLMQLVAVYWLIVPSFQRGSTGSGGSVTTLAASLQWLDVATVVGVGGLWVGFFLWNLMSKPLVPLHDHSVVAIRKHGGGNVE